MQEPIRVDIISDVVCPWCIVGFRQLQAASEASGITIDPYWHPFELNPQMLRDGENIREHIKAKYGSTDAQSHAAREQLVTLGTPLGIDFRFTDESRIYSTFDAHRLMHLAEQTSKSHDLKMALFSAYFTDGRDVSDPDVLTSVAVSVGLDQAAVTDLLANDTFTAEVREKESFWTERGISGVPAMVFATRHLVTGAQGQDNYAQILRHLRDEADPTRQSATN